MHYHDERLVLEAEELFVLLRCVSMLSLLLVDLVLLSLCLCDVYFMLGSLCVCPGSG